MMENRKRPRENVQTTNEPKNKTNPPPSKKRRIETNKNKQSSKKKDMNNWSIDELKKYLNKNAITYQMDKDKSYYHRLASMHKIVQNNKANDKKKKSPPPPPIYENSSFNSVISHKDEQVSPESPLPIYTPPRKPTPPLPFNISHKPLISDSFSEESSSNEGEEPEDNDNDNISDHFDVKTPPIQTATPTTFRSRSLLAQNTPNIQTEFQPQPQIQIQPEIQPQIQPEIQPQIQPQIQIQPQPEIIRRQNARKLGPFQDIPLKIPQMFQFESPMEYKLSDNKFLIFICSIVGIVILAMLLPYLISLFISSPYCDQNMNNISGSYYYGFQSIMKCKSCPFKATECNNGRVICRENYTLDSYGVMCLENDNKNDILISKIAYSINQLLGNKLGAWECNDRNNEFSYKFDENALKNQVYDAYFKNENDDGNVIIEMDEDFIKTWPSAIEIMTNVYERTVTKNISTEEWESLRPIPPSTYCKGIYLKKEYFGDKFIRLDMIYGIIVIIIAIGIIVIVLRSKNKEMDENAIHIANFVLNKLSQQPMIHFSIVTIKNWVMKKQNISVKTWEKSLKCINQSNYVETIPEDIDGNIRMCWKWKAVTPFVPLK